MALAETQRALAQLYTNTQLRHQFCADPVAVSVALGLSAVEASQMARMSPSQLSLFAHSLRRKRLNEIGKMFPLTHRALGLRFDALVEQYFNTEESKGTRTLLEDTQRVAKFLEETLRAERVEVWLRDTARYEAACVKLSRPRSVLMVVSFHFSMADLTRWLLQGKSGALPPSQRVWAVWIRMSPNGRLRHFLISLPRSLSRGNNGPLS